MQPMSLIQRRRSVVELQPVDGHFIVPVDVDGAAARLPESEPPARPRLDGCSSIRRDAGSERESTRSPLGSGFACLLRRNAAQPVLGAGPPIPAGPDRTMCRTELRGPWKGYVRSAAQGSRSGFRAIPRAVGSGCLRTGSPKSRSRWPEQWVSDPYSHAVAKTLATFLDVCQSYGGLARPVKLKVRKPDDIQTRS